MNEQPFAQHRFLGRMNLAGGVPPSQFILYNHVTDYFYYGSGHSRFLPIVATLERYLLDLGYEIIARYSVTTELQFAEAAMRERYQKITVIQSRPNSYGRPPSPPNTEEPGSEPPVRAGANNDFTGLGKLLRQGNCALADFVKAAVIIERAQNLFSDPPQANDRLVLDQLQSWSSLINGNVSILIADVADVKLLPAALIGSHRSGVKLIDVGLPSQDEVNKAFISAEQGLMELDFGQTVESARSKQETIVQVAVEQRAELKNRLAEYDIVTIAGLFRECTHLGIGELNLRTLRQMLTQSSEAWLDVLTRQNLLAVEEEITTKHVLGQEYAVHQVVRALAAAGEDLREQAINGRAEEKLLGYFFFAGPTGVGKTEVFRRLADAFPQVRTRKFNMPEYKEEHSVARFFGAPPGYVGHGRGELGQFLIDNPATMVLFDEFEKAHPNVWKNFLTMLEGSLTTGDGVRVDLSQAIFIFTSNAGASDLLPIDPAMSAGEQENTRNRNRGFIETALRQSGAPPELIGRLLEAIIPFNHLTEPIIQNIIAGKLRKLAERFHVYFHPSVSDFILDLYAQQAHFGARPVAHYIDMKLKADLSEMEVHDGAIYKQEDGVTCRANTPRDVGAAYVRRQTPAQSRRQTPLRMDTSSERQFRDSVAPAIAAVLTYVTDGASGIRTFRGSGTGFFVSQSGVLLTNRHVVEDATGILAICNNGQLRLDMVLLSVSHYYDLAVLRPAQTLTNELPFLALSNSGDVEVDTAVVTYGYPYLRISEDGSQISYTQPERSEQGHIGVRQEAERLFRLAGCGLNPGNSGGPLFTCADGRVIGIVMAKQTQSEGMSFAIMSAVADEMLHNLGILDHFTRIESRRA